MLGKFVRGWVLTQSDLADLLGGGAADLRVSPWKRPQRDALPALTYTFDFGERVRSLTGGSGLAHDSGQLQCWGRTYAEAWQIARLVRGEPGDARLDFYSGTVADVVVRVCYCTNPRDVPEPPGFADDVGFPCVQLDLDVWWDDVV